MPLGCYILRCTILDEYIVLNGINFRYLFNIASLSYGDVSNWKCLNMHKDISFIEMNGHKYNSSQFRSVENSDRWRKNYTNNPQSEDD
jgi:hypothetical protein